MSSKTILAIDPGKNGGLAWRKDGIVSCQHTPETRRDTIDLIKSVCDNPDCTVCYHEKVAEYIPDGGASAMIVYGKMIERCECIAETLGVRVIAVPPKEWQKYFNFGVSGRVAGPKPPKGATKKEVTAFKKANKEAIKATKSMNAKLKTEWKNKLLAESQRRFPKQKVTKATADALLILDYAIAQERD